MKSRSLAYWRLPEEEQFFLEAFAAVQETIVFPVLRAPTRRELRPMPLSEYIPQWKTGKVLLACPGTKVAIQSRRGKHPRHTILAYRSPVAAHFAGRVIEETVLEANLLEFYSSFLNEEKAFEKNEPAFLKWCEKLRKVILANTVVWKDRRLTKRALAARKQYEYF